MKHAMKGIPVSIIRFLIVGLANTLVGFSVIWVFEELMGIGNLISNLLGYVFGVCVSFIFNRRWSFSFHGEWLGSFLRFLVVFVIAYGTNLIVVFGAMALVHSDSVLLQLFGMPPYSIVFYFGCRRYAFPP